MIRKYISAASIVIFLTNAGLAISMAQNKESRTAQMRSSGVLLLAHGGRQNWNDEVMKVASAIDKTQPVEVAFGMASKRSMQTAIDRLIERGAKEIIAVPLFISRHSSVITATQYLLGLRPDAPPELAAFARMDHGHGSHGTSHKPDPSFDPMTPIRSRVPIRMTDTLGRHPLVAEILLSRAKSISREPQREVVVLVAHGPVSDESNAKWLDDMRSLAERMRQSSNFKRIEYLTVRDDAPAPIREKATAELRAVVSKITKENSRVLIAPLLLSYGGIEEGIRKRLEWLDYTMPDQALLPDERIIEWVRLAVAGRNK